MPTWAKILIIVGLVIILGVIAVIAGAAYWWSRNKDSIIARGKAEVTEGRELGRTSDNQGCVDESVLRYKKDPGLKSVIATSIFMRTCLDISRPTPGFCDDVPKQTEFTKTAQWRVAQCERVNLKSDTYCQQLFTQMQEFCATGPLRTNEDTNTNTP